MQHTNAISALRARWKTEWNIAPLAAPLAAHLSTIGNAVGVLQREAQSLKASGKLTDVGIKETVREKAKAESVPALRRAHHATEASRKGIEASKAKLLAPGFDKTDIAAAMLRQEIRSHLAGLTQAERIAVLAQTDDRRVLEAFHELPIIAPVPADFMARLIEDQLETHHGPEVKAIREAEAAVEIIEGMLADAVRLMKAEVDFPSDAQFDVFMTEASRPVDVEFAPRARTITDLTEAERSAAMSAAVDAVFASYGIPPAKAA